VISLGITLIQAPMAVPSKRPRENTINTIPPQTMIINYDDTGISDINVLSE